EHTDRHETRRWRRAQTALPNQTPPRAQQIWIDVVPRRNRSHAAAWLMRLSNNPQLLFHAPAAPPFAGADDFDRAIRHRFKVDLKVGFKVTASAYFASSKQGGPHRTLTAKARLKATRRSNGGSCVRQRTCGWRRGRCGGGRRNWRRKNDARGG